MSKRSWTKEDLILAVSLSRSIRQVISRLNLVEAGGNYEQISLSGKALFKALN